MVSEEMIEAGRKTAWQDHGVVLDSDEARAIYLAMSQASPIEDGLPWLVWSHEHNAFWRPNNCGYTRLIEKAGRYSKAEAEAICRDADYRTNAERKRADPEVPPSEICFPSPEAAQSIRVMREEIEGLRGLRNFVSCAENDVTMDMARKLFDLPDYSSTGKARSALGASGE